MRSGKEEQKYKNGGNWDNGIRSGIGKYIYSNSERYKGKMEYIMDMENLYIKMVIYIRVIGLMEINIAKENIYI